MYGEFTKKNQYCRYYSISNFDIHYFSGTSNINDDSYSMADRIFSALERIVLLNGNIIIGNHMSCHKEDGIMHIFVNFNVSLKNIETEQDLMETLKTTVKET